MTARVPCRIDCGGTLDIDPLALGLMVHSPATFNIALKLRTEVRVRRTRDRARLIHSAGFASLALEPGQEADYTSPLGFFLLALDYFGLEGVELTIASASPPRSALGGSSAAILAAVAALARLVGRRITRLEAVGLAHQIESALFETSCGRQDHLAAAYGGVRLWTWTPGLGRGHRGRKLLKGAAYPGLEKRLLIAYPGQTHSSAEVNSTWVRGFLTGRTRETWRRIAALTRGLAGAVERGDWAGAAGLIREETALRTELTPEVLTDSGRALLAEAERCGAGARFSGAGGGGCVFALGSLESIQELKPRWAEMVGSLPGGRLLPTGIDRKGLVVRAEQAPARA